MSKRFVISLELDQRHNRIPNDVEFTSDFAMLIFPSREKKLYKKLSSFC